MTPIIPRTGRDGLAAAGVIDPASTRAVLVDALSTLAAKHDPLPSRMHGNAPV
jgi:hypothetical protein